MHAELRHPSSTSHSFYSRSEESILDLLRSGETLTVEEIVERVPEVGWAQLFLALDDLSRRGDICLHRHGFTYEVWRQPVAIAQALSQQAVSQQGLDGTTNSDRR